MTTPYHFGFLDRITAVNFGGKKYVIYFIVIDHVAFGTNPPGKMSTTWSSTSTGVKLVEQQHFSWQKLFPDTFRTWYTVWNNVAPLPTQDTFFVSEYGNAFGPSGQIVYGTQFSQVLLINHSVQTPIGPPIHDASGFYTDLAQAQLAADYINTHYLHGHPSGSTLGYANELGGITDPFTGPAITDAFAIATRLNNKDALAQTVQGDYYLFEVPDDSATVHFSALKAPGKDIYAVDAYGASYSKLKKQPTLASLGITAPATGKPMPILPTGGFDDYSHTGTTSLSSHFDFTGITKMAVDTGEKFLSVAVTTDGRV